MSTLDVIALAGGRPANFCDLGGGGDAEGVVDALEVITADPQVKSIFFNIFGGITRCDEVARGILAALDRMTIDAADRRAPRRDERRGGAAPPRRRRRPRTSTSSRRCSTRRGARRGAGRVTDVWSERAGGVPRERDAPRGPGPRPARRVVRARRGRAGARRRHRRRARRARLREAGCDVVSVDPAPGMQPDVVARAEDIPFADDSLRRRRLPDRAAPLRRRPRRRRRDGARRPRPRRRRGQPLPRRGGRGGREAARPDARPLLLRGRVARASSPTPGSTVEDERTLRASRSRSSRGSRASRRRRRGRRARPRAARRPHRGRPIDTRSIVLKGRKR